MKVASIDSTELLCQSPVDVTNDPATGTGGANDGTGDQTESRNSLWDAEW